MLFKLKFIVFSFLVLLSCGSTEKLYTPESYTKAKITFGNYGGFAGTKTKYVLLENGQLFKYPPRSDQYTEAILLDKRVTDQIFETYKTLGFDKYDFNDPGNLTYFFQYDDGKAAKKFAWGGINGKVDTRLRQLYSNLINLSNQTQTATQ